MNGCRPMETASALTKDGVSDIFDVASPDYRLL